MEWLPLEGVDHAGHLTRESPPGIYVRVFADGSEGGRFRQSPVRLSRVRAIDDAHLNTVIHWSQRGDRPSIARYRRIES